MKNYNYFFISPQKPEEVFPRAIKGGETIILSGIKPPKKSNNISLTINSLYGSPEIYTQTTKNFPFCSEDELMKSLNKVENNILPEFEFGNYTPFSQEQRLFFFSCPPANEFCIFDSTFFSKDDYIILKEGKFFSQLLLDNESNYFTADFETHKNIKEIIIELIIFNGNAKLNFVNNLKIANYFLLNKFIYKIKVDDLNNDKKIKFSVSCTKKSFYSVRYTSISINDINEMNLLDIMGLNYIDYLDNENKYKIIKIQNSKYNIVFPILFNFYSPNCKFQINQTNPSTILNDNFYQEYFESDEEKGNIYNISIKEFEPLQYKDKKCILISNVLKIANEKSIKFGNLIINENIPYIQKFEKVSGVKYIYPNFEYNKELFIHFKLINNRKYFINITDSAKNTIAQQYISSSEIIHISNRFINKNQKNYLIIELSLQESSNNDTAIVKTIVRQIKDNFFYLEKGEIKEEIVTKNNDLYLYTDIGKDDQGFIMIDLLKEKGEIKGKIVERKDININEEVKWDSINNGKDILNYDFYSKKLFFTRKDTSTCENGCYLLISIKAPVIKGMEKEMNYFPIYVMASVITKNIYDSIKIRIDPDQYIFGTLHKNNFEDEKMFELYELNIPYDAESIEIECFSNFTKLLIYVKNSQIDYENKDFIVDPGQINIISKSDILDLKGKGNSIENINIIICVSAEKRLLTDIAYSFRVHLNKNNKLKIYKIINDNKALCEPVENDNNEYRCLFMIKPSNLNCLIIYAKSQPDNGNIVIYGNYLGNNDWYDFFEENNLNNIPDKESRYTNQEKGIIFLPATNNKNYLYLSVISNNSNIIELFFNFYNYYNEFIPNPNLIQLFILEKYKEEIKLYFISKNGIMVSIVKLKGEGELTFENKKYNLKENNNKLLFAFNSDIEDILNAKIKNEDNFIFYIEYSFRNSTINLDEINVEENSLISYKNEDYPIFIYSKIEKNFGHDINIFFNFYNLTLNNEKDLSKCVINKELKIYFLLENEKDKFKYIMALNETEKNQYQNKIIGSYDPAISTGQIYIPKNYTSKMISSESKDLYILTIEKNGYNKDIIYKIISMKPFWIKENSDNQIVENKYHFGKIFNDNDRNIYKLRIKEDVDYIILQFSANSQLVNYTIFIIEANDNKTIDADEKKEENGKIITKYRNLKSKDYLYLKVFINDNLDITENLHKLKNYMFKYNNIIKNDKTNEYSILNNNKITCTITEKKGKRISIQVSYNKVKNQQMYEVIYSVRIVKKADLIEGELYNTIAITESNNVVAQIRKYYVDDKKNIINIPLNVFNEKEFAYIELIAQIIDGDNIEYIAYKPITSANEIVYKKVKEINKVAIIIIIIVILLILIIIIVVIFLKFKKKQKNNDDADDTFKQVEMTNPIEYDDILLDKQDAIN